MLRIVHAVRQLAGFVLGTSASQAEARPLLTRAQRKAARKAAAKAVKLR